MAKQTILPAEVAAKYDYTFPGERLRTSIGDINFRQITLEQADQLKASGFKHLVLRPTPIPDPEPEQLPKKPKRKNAKGN